MTDEERYFDVLTFSGTVIRGAWKTLYAGGELVGYYFPTNDGLHHVLDASNGSLVDVFSSADEAMAFARRHWNEDGLVVGDNSPPTRQ